MLSREGTQGQLEEYDRRCGVRSLFYLCRFLLGYTKFELDPHKETCDYIQNLIYGEPWTEDPNDQRGGLLMEPRGAFKTSIASQGLPVLILLNDPNARILLDSSVLQNSIDNVRVVKNHFEHNQKIRYLYGDYKGEYWVTEEATISKRTDKNLKEPSIRASSVGKAQTGPHYEFIITDDTVSKENSETPESRKKVKDHIRLLWSLLEPGGVMVIIGTHWNYDDAYMDLRDKKKYPEIRVRVKSAYKENGDLYFPQRLTRAFLEGQKRRQLRDIFSAQYLNDPAPEDEDSAFKRAWFKPYPKTGLPEGTYPFVMVDPGGKDKGNDEWAMFLAHTSYENDLYFHRFLKGLWRTDVAWELLFQWYEKYKFLTCGLEITAGQKYLLEGLYTEMRRRNIFFNVQPLPHARISKMARIKNLQPRYQAGSIYHSDEMGPLEDQLVRIPKGKDDIADAAAGILEVSIAPAQFQKSGEHEMTLDEIIRLQIAGELKKEPSHEVLGVTY